MIDPESGGRSRTLLILEALLCGYWTLNLSCNDSISSLTSPIRSFWYSLIAPLIRGLTNKALNRENIRNISLAFLAVPSWSLNLAVILVSTRSILSPYLKEMIKRWVNWNIYKKDKKTISIKATFSQTNASITSKVKQTEIKHLWVFKSDSSSVSSRRAIKF